MSSFHEALRGGRITPKTERLTRSSRWLHEIDHCTSQPWATLLLGAILVSAVVLGAVLGFPGIWTTAFEVGASFITLMMVVIIQHTQGRNKRQFRENLTSCYERFPRQEAHS